MKPLPEGPWSGEPDSDDWTDRDTGLPCCARRGPLHHWCGYVGVEKGHPLFGLNVSDPVPQWAVDHAQKVMQGPVGKRSPVELFIHALSGGGIEGMCVSLLLNVHGGISFCGSAWLAPKDHWFFGFDCAHAGDLSPGMLRYTSRQLFGEETYRTLDYVRNETGRLARQLHDLAELAIKGETIA